MTGLLSPAGVFAAFSANDVRLPLSPSAVDIGVILDADGNEVFTVDVNGERPDEETSSIAELLVDLVNTVAGFGKVRL